MTLSSPYNIYSPGTVNGPPTSVELGLMATSVNSALANTFGAHVQIKPVATVTARSAYLASFGTPTASKPCAVFRANAQPGSEIEYTTNGTVWRRVATGVTVASGTVTTTSVPSNGGSEDITATFPFTFANAPIVTVTPANPRVNMGLGTLTTTSVVLRAFNWTTVSIGSTALHWHAISTI